MVKRGDDGATRRSVSRVVLPYFLFGAAWILFSDRLLLPLAGSAENLLWLSTVKGWAFIVVTASLLYVLVFREIRKRSVLEDALRKGLAEEEALLAEVHHRVKNNLQVITSILNLESDGIKGEEARNLNGSTRARLRSMSLVHEQLYNASGISSIGLGGHLRDLVGTLPDLFDIPDARIDYDLDAIEVGPDLAITFGLFATEAVTNALRHGAGADGSRDLSLSLRAQGDDAAEFVVRDHGAGIPEEETRQGLGFRLMEALADQLRGEMSISNEAGAVVTLRFPTKGTGRG
jgi:two-component system, sensor histidine kinase PdtaS